jgi:hypothetical protein
MIAVAIAMAIMTRSRTKSRLTSDSHAWRGGTASRALARIGADAVSMDWSAR